MCCLGAGTGGRILGAGTGGRCLGAGTGVDFRGRSESADSRGRSGSAAGCLDSGEAGRHKGAAGWFRLGPGNFPDTGRSPLPNIILWCLGDPWGGGNRSRAGTVGGWSRRPALSWRQACRIPWHTRRR